MKAIPFDKKELIPVGEQKPMFPGMPARPKYATPITPRENYMLLLSGETPLWMPSMGDTAMLCPKVPDNIARGFVFEAEPFDMACAGGTDMFGVEWEYVPVAGGSMIREGDPKIPDITRWEDYIEFPDIDKIIDWEAMAERNRGYIDRDKALVITILNGLFERLISFMNMQGAMIALVDEDEQEGVHRLFDRLCDFYDDYIGHYKKYLDCDVINFHDDWGSQRAPFFSLDAAMEMLVPYLKRIVDSAHRHGCRFDLHCCGKNELLVPAMIAAGVDSWSGQPMNDYEMMYEKYGDKIVLGMPIGGITDGMSDEELYKAIEVFVRQHPRAMGSMFMGPPKAGEYLYEISRKVYCG